jgi:hypothetical protein
MTVPILAIGSPSQPSRPLLPLNKPFAEWELRDAAVTLAAAVEQSVGTKGYQQNRAYVVERDHWQQGSTWLGPQGTVVTQARVLSAVRRQFTAVDTIGEVLDRFVSALLDRKPCLAFVPRDPTVAASDDHPDPDPQVQEVEARLREWAEKRHLWELVATAIERSRWAGWGVLRAWVPPSQLVRPVAPGAEPLSEAARAADRDNAPEPLPEAMFPSGLTLEAALDRIHVTAPESREALVYQDPETRERAAVFTYLFDRAEYGELWWVDGDTGRTVVRQFRDGPATQTELDLGGRLPFTQMTAKVLITEAVRQQQARQNFFESVLVRVGETAGFAERYTLNAKPTGVWMPVPPSDGPALETIEQEGKTWYLHPMPRSLGASITTDLYGVQDTDIQGSRHTLTPGVVFKEPTDPTYAITAAEHARHTILRQCKQGHIEQLAERQLSGVSRLQARSDFVSDANHAKEQASAMLRDLFEVVLAYAAQMSFELGDFLARYRASVTMYVSPGPLTAEERTAITGQVKDGTLSLETALQHLGADNPEAEAARIRTSPEGQRAALLQQTQAVLALVQAGAALATAAQIAGLTEEQVALLQADAGLVPSASAPPEARPRVQAVA